MIYTPRLIKISSGIQKLIGEIDIQRQQGDFIRLLLFFSKQGKSAENKITLSVTDCWNKK
jgi:hypothetical protein